MNTHAGVAQQSASQAGKSQRGTIDQSVGWTETAWLVAALAFVGWLYWEVFVWLNRMWQTPDYSHAYFVPLFSLFLIWRDRQALAGLVDRSPKIQGMLLGFAGIGVGLLLRLVGIYTRIWTLEGLSLIPFLFGVVGIVLGQRAALRMWPPILFLVFMIPLPAALAGKMGVSLQMIATNVSTFGLQTLGMPAVSEGNVILLEGGDIGVAEACSGLRMLYAFFALTVGSCLVLNRYWWENLAIIVSAIPIAVAVNCIRIITTGMALQLSSKEVAEYIFHDLAGWLMMPMGFGLLAGLLWVFDNSLVYEKKSKAKG